MLSTPIGYQKHSSKGALREIKQPPLLLNHSIPDDLLLTAEMPDHRGEPMTRYALMGSIDDRNDGSSEFAQEISMERWKERWRMDEARS